MSTARIRIIITKIHYYLLGFALLNFLIKNTLEISLNYRFAFLITVLLYISGFILFFWNLSPFKKLAIYFSIYIITPILTLLFWMFGGIFFGLLASIVLYPIYPNEIKAENDKIVVYTKYQGFMGACCPYNVTEKKYLLLEKKIAEINIDDIFTFKNASIELENGKTELRIKYDKYDYETKKNIATDTIIVIKKE